SVTWIVQIPARWPKELSRNTGFRAWILFTLSDRPFLAPERPKVTLGCSPGWLSARSRSSLLISSIRYVHTVVHISIRQEAMVNQPLRRQNPLSRGSDLSENAAP